MKESTQDAWRIRYGSEPPENLNQFGTLLNHRSVRKFTNEQVPESTIAGLVACAQSAATSSNLQAWSIVSVQNPENRASIAALCGNQKQIIGASWFFAFMADLNRLCTFAESKADAIDTVEMYSVAVIDAALAAERMVVAAESIGLGICYIGAIRNKPDEVKELLRLPTHTFPVFGLCIGVPDESAKAAIKPRLHQEQIWFRETYAETLDVDEYNQRAAEFFGNQGMANDATWAQKSAVRASNNGLSGREHLQSFLDKQKLNQR
jgi:nitroreductase